MKFERCRCSVILETELNSSYLPIATERCWCVTWGSLTLPSSDQTSLSFCQKTLPLFFPLWYQDKKENKHSLRIGEKRNSFFHLMLDFLDNNKFIEWMEKARTHNWIIFKLRFFCWEARVLSRQAWQVELGFFAACFKPKPEAERQQREAASLQVLPGVGRSSQHLELVTDDCAPGRCHVTSAEPHPLSFPF